MSFITKHFCWFAKIWYNSCLQVPIEYANFNIFLVNENIGNSTYMIDGWYKKNLIMTKCKRFIPIFMDLQFGWLTLRFDFQTAQRLFRLYEDAANGTEKLWRNCVLYLNIIYDGWNLVTHCYLICCVMLKIWKWNTFLCIINSTNLSNLWKILVLFPPKWY